MSESEFVFGVAYPIETALQVALGEARVLVWVPAIPPHQRGFWTAARWNDDRHAVRPRPFWDMERYSRISWSRENQPTLWMPMPPDPVETPAQSEQA